MTIFKKTIKIFLIILSGFYVLGMTLSTFIVVYFDECLKYFHYGWPLTVYSLTTGNICNPSGTHNLEFDGAIFTIDNNVIYPIKQIYYKNIVFDVIFYFVIFYFIYKIIKKFRSHKPTLKKKV